jgi:myosin protein heavy chain
MNSLKQRHELELSEAKSQIRSLETSVFDAESTCRALQKQVTDLKDELQRLQALSEHRRSSSLHKAHLVRRFTDDMHRSSFSTVNESSPMFYSAIDEGLPPAIRHQRQISLGMLQARMYSESEALLQTLRTEEEAYQEHDADSSHERHPSHTSVDYPHRSQFLDENHVFWCASCKGDLIVL